MMRAPTGPGAGFGTPPGTPRGRRTLLVERVPTAVPRRGRRTGQPTDVRNAVNRQVQAHLRAVLA